MAQAGTTTDGAVERSASAGRLVSEEELKHRWSQVRSVTRDTLQILDRIADRAWVVSECLRFEAATIDEARLVLQCALNHAVAYAVQDQLTSEDRAAPLHLTEEEISLCALRLRVLHALDMLELHVRVAHADNVPAEARAAMALRERSLVDEAVCAARAGRSEAARALLEGEGGGAESGVWAAVEALPDPAPPALYEPLLRGALAPPAGLRAADWAEDARLAPRTAARLPPHIAAHFARRLSAAAAPVDVADARLCARVRTVERRTGWAEGAAAVCALALSLWPDAPGLQRLDHALRQLCALVYDTGALDTQLATLEAEPDEAGRVALLLAALPDEPPAALRARLPTFVPRDTARHVGAALAARLAPQSGQLGRVLALLSFEAATPASLRLLTPASLLVRTTLAAVYASPDPPAPHLAALERLALALAALLRTEQAAQDEDREAVATLSGQVAALKLLLPYGVAWRLADLAACAIDPDKGAWLLEWLVRQGVARRAPRSAAAEVDRLWRELLADLRFLQHAPLGPAFASAESVAAAALSGLLAAQRFALAAELVARPDFPPPRARSLCLAAARAHTDGAASLADTEGLEAAGACLELALSTPESSTNADLARERSFLSALRRLAADEAWRRALALWPPSRIRTTDAVQLGALLVAAPLAYRRTAALMDVLSLLGASRARTLPLLLAAASAALDAGDEEACAALLAQLHDANHAPAVALTRRWLSALPPAATARPYEAAKQALGFLAAHDSLLPHAPQPSVPHLFLLAHVAPPSAPARSLGALAASPPPLVSAPPPPPSPTSLSAHRFYRPAPTAPWSPSPPAARLAALLQPDAAPPPTNPDPPLLLAALLHQPPRDALAAVAQVLASPDAPSLPLLRTLLTAVCVHHCGLPFLRAASAAQLDALRGADVALASRFAELLTQARAQDVPDPRLLLSSPAPLVALHRLDAERRTELLQSALLHALDAQPSDIPALLSLSAQASVEPALLVRTASQQKLKSASGTAALRKAQVSLTWPSVELEGAETVETLLVRTAKFTQSDASAELWLQLLRDAEPSAQLWASVLPLLLAPSAVAHPAAFLRTVLHRFAQTSTASDEGALLASLRSADSASLLLLEAALGAQSAEVQEKALSDLLKHPTPLAIEWPGVALLPAPLVARLRTAHAPLYGHLLRLAAKAPAGAAPRLCHPAELTLSALIANSWLTDAAAVQLLLVPSGAATTLDAQLLRMWRRVSLLGCGQCQAQRQAALAVLTRLVG